MNETRLTLLELNKEIHKKMLKKLVFDNKEFEKEAISLFAEYFEADESIQEKYYKEHPNELNGLDGGCTSELRKLYREHFKRFDELKKRYGIKL